MNRAQADHFKPKRDSLSLPGNVSLLRAGWQTVKDCIEVPKPFGLLLQLGPHIRISHSPCPVASSGAGMVHAPAVVQPHDILQHPGNQSNQLHTTCILQAGHHVASIMNSAGLLGMVLEL